MYVYLVKLELRQHGISSLMQVRFSFLLHVLYKLSNFDEPTAYFRYFNNIHAKCRILGIHLNCTHMQNLHKKQAYTSHI